MFCLNNDRKGVLSLKRVPSLLVKNILTIKCVETNSLQTHSLAFLSNVNIPPPPFHLVKLYEYFNLVKYM